MTYQWKIPLYPVDAQEAGEELQRIGDEAGSITDETVVEASRYEDAVLHRCFEWNNETAAIKYRLKQAQDIIRNIVVVSINGKLTDKPVRAFVSIQNEYKSIENVIVSVDYTAEMLRNAMTELVAFREKYNTLAELAGVFTSISEFVEQQAPVAV